MSADLRAIAGALIPAGRGLPAGGEVDLDWPAAAVPQVREELQRAVSALAGAPDPVCALEDLRARDARAAATLEAVVAAAYYRDPRVASMIGFDGRRAREVVAAGLEAELEPLIARVAARGPRWREPPPRG